MNNMIINEKFMSRCFEHLCGPAPMLKWTKGSNKKKCVLAIKKKK